MNYKAYRTKHGKEWGNWMAFDEYFDYRVSAIASKKDGYWIEEGIYYPKKYCGCSKTIL